MHKFRRQRFTINLVRDKVEFEEEGILKLIYNKSGLSFFDFDLLY